MPDEIRGLAPAKVNLVLEVTGLRPDGYHEIDTVLQTLELADTLTLSVGIPGVSITGPRAVGTPADESNIAWGAAVALAQRLGERVDNLHIAIDKHIPAAGGLGGGASDAATTLRLLQRWWPAATDDAVLESANAVGSDVAFFLTGGTARAQGRGECITPLPGLARHGVVLFVPNETIERKTARMFAALDRLPWDDGSVAAAFAANMPGRVTGSDVYNAFERVAFDVFPGLASVWEAIEGRIDAPVRLAGAGPTLFWIGKEDARAGVAAAARDLDCVVIETATAASLWKQ